MNENNLFTEECLQVGSQAKDKSALLREIAALAKKSPVLADIKEEELFRGLSEREKSGTTGFGDGIAIPHCFFDKIDNFVVGLLVTAEGADFEAMDNKKAQLFFFIVAPASQRSKHIRILSSVSRMVKNTAVVRSLLTAGNSRELNSIVNRSLQYRDENNFKTEYCQLTIYLQREDIFNDVLEILSTCTDGTLAVVDSASAGHYLHRMPLFSTFWSEGSKHFSRLIFCVVRKKLLNNVLRQVYAVRDDLVEGHGLQVTASDLICNMGKIDY